MPRRTLITTSSGIGLGIMGKRFAEMFPDCWERVICFPTRAWDGIELEIKHPRVVKLASYGDINDSVRDGERVFFVESSYGGLKHADALMVPMFESPFTKKDAGAISRLRVISPNEACAEHMRVHYDVESEVLRSPLDLDEFPFRERERAQVIVHNAGSLGQQLRKGTDLAVRAWQRSGLGREGLRLVLHAFLPPTPELAQLIGADPQGIEWRREFASHPSAIYEAGDVLLHCARAEGDALTTVEAMACGLPVIYPDYAPVSEVALGGPWAVQIERETPIPWHQIAVHHHLDVQSCTETLRWAAGADLRGYSREAWRLAELHHDLRRLRERWTTAILAD